MVRIVVVATAVVVFAACWLGNVHCGLIVIKGDANIYGENVTPVNLPGLRPGTKFVSLPQNTKWRDFRSDDSWKHFHNTLDNRFDTDRQFADNLKKKMREEFEKDSAFGHSSGFFNRSEKDESHQVAEERQSGQTSGNELSGQSQSLGGGALRQTQSLGGEGAISDRSFLQKSSSSESDQIRKAVALPIDQTASIVPKAAVQPTSFLEVGQVADQTNGVQGQLQNVGANTQGQVEKVTSADVAGLSNRIGVKTENVALETDIKSGLKVNAGLDAKVQAPIVIPVNVSIKKSEVTHKTETAVASAAATASGGAASATATASTLGLDGILGNGLNTALLNHLTSGVLGGVSGGSPLAVPLQLVHQIGLGNAAASATAFADGAGSAAASATAVAKSDGTHINENKGNSDGITIPIINKKVPVDISSLSSGNLLGNLPV